MMMMRQKRERRQKRKNQQRTDEDMKKKGTNECMMNLLPLIKLLVSIIVVHSSRMNKVIKYHYIFNIKK